MNLQMSTAVKNGLTNFNSNDFNSNVNLTNSVAEKASTDRKNGVSGKSAFSHLLKSCLGSGILAMPMAFSNGGLVFSAFATIFVGLLCTHTVQMLVKCSQSLCQEMRVPQLNFAETAYNAFKSGPVQTRKYAKFAYDFIDIGMTVTYYTGSTIYIVFIASSFREVLNYRLGVELDNRIYIAIIFMPVMIIAHVHSLKYLVPFSSMANLLIVIVFGILLYYIFSVPLEFGDKYLLAPVSKIPVFFATVVFALEGIGTIMPIENSMQHPRSFPIILNLAMGCVVFFYGLVGFFGYMRFGNEVRASITLNLPKEDM